MGQYRNRPDRRVAEPTAQNRGNPRIPYTVTAAGPVFTLHLGSAGVQSDAAGITPAAFGSFYTAAGDRFVPDSVTVDDNVTLIVECAAMDGEPGYFAFNDDQSEFLPINGGTYTGEPQFIA